MIPYVLPIALVVLSNTLYQICAKSVPDSVSPFASLTVTYLVAAVFSAVLFFVTGTEHNIMNEFGRMNWAPYGLGLVIVGLEVGMIYAYKVGWQVSTAAIVQSAFLGIALIFVGGLLYHEAMTWNKLLGIGICLVGLTFINLK